MKKNNLAIIYMCASLTLCLMYATQPIQPILELELGISQFKALLFTTSIMAPLAVASVLYGYILEKISIKKLLIVAMFFMGILEFAFVFFDTYFMLINIRGIQGLIIPAALTGFMSYISHVSSKEELPKFIGMYISATIFGGFIGRFLSAYFTSLFGWRFFIVVVAICMIFLSLILFKIEDIKKINLVKPCKKDIVSVFINKDNFFIFLMIFCLFFSLQAMLNFIPFEISKINGEFSGFQVGAVYFGYLIGMIVSLNAKRILVFFNSAKAAINFGLIAFLIALPFFLMQSFYVFFVAMIVVCFGNFLVHTIASGHINSLATSNKSITNGLYVSFYYSGGALGSFVPGIIYSNFGWSIFLFFIGFILLSAILFTSRIS